MLLLTDCAPLLTAWKAGVFEICLISTLFNVPLSEITISSAAAGCVAKAVAPVILVTSNPPTYVFILDAAVFLSVPPAPSSTKNNSASANAPPITVWPVKKA